MSIGLTTATCSQLLTPQTLFPSVLMLRRPAQHVQSASATETAAVLLLRHSNEHESNAVT